MKHKKKYQLIRYKYFWIFFYLYIFFLFFFFFLLKIEPFHLCMGLCIWIIIWVCVCRPRFYYIKNDKTSDCIVRNYWKQMICSRVSVVFVVVLCDTCSIFSIIIRPVMERTFYPCTHSLFHTLSFNVNLINCSIDTFNIFSK